jgi:hypothetical protein
MSHFRRLAVWRDGTPSDADPGPGEEAARLAPHPDRFDTSFDARTPPPLGILTVVSPCH